MISAGEGVTGWNAGDRLIAAKGFGGLAEQIVIPAASAIELANTIAAAPSAARSFNLNLSPSDRRFAANFNVQSRIGKTFSWLVSLLGLRELGNWAERWGSSAPMGQSAST